VCGDCCFRILITLGSLSLVLALFVLLSTRDVGLVILILLYPVVFRVVWERLIFVLFVLLLGFVFVGVGFFGRCPLSDAGSWGVRGGLLYYLSLIRACWFSRSCCVRFALFSFRSLLCSFLRRGSGSLSSLWSCTFFLALAYSCWVCSIGISTVVGR